LKSMLAAGGRIILQTTLVDHFGTRIVRALSSRRELVQRGYRFFWFSERDITYACSNAGLLVLQKRKNGLGITFGDRLWRSLNFQLEKRLQEWSSRHGADAIYLLAGKCKSAFWSAAFLVRLADSSKASADLPGR